VEEHANNELEDCLQKVVDMWNAITKMRAPMLNHIYIQAITRPKFGSERACGYASRPGCSFANLMSKDAGALS
jgi:hypothetical protein